MTPPASDRWPGQPAPRAAAWFDRAAAALDSFVARIGLSLLIILSLLPDGAVSALLADPVRRNLDRFFLAVFAPELLVRAAVYLWRRRAARTSTWEAVLLLLDLLAVVSFLPVQHLFAEARYFRLFRLSRMVLLIGYWGTTARDLWRILTGRERRYQVLIVLCMGALLSFASAVTLSELSPRWDYDQDGRVGEGDRSLWRILWWSFRQVQDSGNLVVAPSDAVVVLASLLLTFAGLLLFSFMIGIGTGAVDELLRRALDRPVGLSDHNVILGLGRYSHLLLGELADIYRKNRRTLKAAVLGSSARPPDYLHGDRLRRVEYRHGDPLRAEDLAKVSVSRARRVLVLGTDPDGADGAVIASILATRNLNPRVHIYADLQHERNFRAARSAGGPRTHLVGSGSFLGQYLAQNVVYPGIHRVYRQLLTPEGAEVYTYELEPDERRRLRRPDGGPGIPYPALHAWAVRCMRVTPLAIFVARGEEEVELEDCALLLNPADPACREQAEYAFDADGRLRLAALRGLAGVALRFEDLRSLARVLVKTVPGEQTAAAAGRGEVVLQPAAGRATRVLVCGASGRVPRVVREILESYGPVEVTVLVREADQVERLVEDVQSHIQEAFGGLVRSAPDAIAVAMAGGEARIRVFRLDWSDADRIVRHADVDLATLDVALFLPREGAGDPGDGLVALDCLRLADLEREGVIRFQPGFRALGLVHDPLKAELLERRLDLLAGPGQDCRWTVLSGERAVNDFLVQCLFVRGLNRVYLEVLGTRGQQLQRLVPRSPRGGTPVGGFDAWDLARALLERQRLLVGFEIARPGGHEVILDPAALAPGRRLEWSTVAALFVLGRSAAPGSRWGAAGGAEGGAEGGPGDGPGDGPAGIEVAW